MNNSKRSTFRHLFAVSESGLTIKITAESAAIYTFVYAEHLLSNTAGSGKKMNPELQLKRPLISFYVVY